MSEPEDDLERYERLAAEYHRKFGQLAPGKDSWVAGPLSGDENRKRWRRWLEERATVENNAND